MMKTYFEVDDRRFESREEAITQMDRWKASIPALSVCEVQNAEVTRKTAKGHTLTELARGNVEQGPRITSIRKLAPTYIIVTDGRRPRMDGTPSSEVNGSKHFSTAADAEQERAKRQGEAERLAALTVADIREVYVPTLADILERDAGKIDCLVVEMDAAKKHMEETERQTVLSVSAEIANLERQIHALRADAAKRFGLQRAQEKFTAAVQAYIDAIHLDEFEDQVSEKLQDQHHDDCWPSSECRSCTYEPDSDEIEEYLLEHADEFEVNEITNEPAKPAQSTAVAGAQTQSVLWK
jgi:hypothetical protein